MKTSSLRLLLCLALLGSVCDCSHAVGKITVDPNTGGSTAPKVLAASDARLAQKVTYEAQYRSVQQIIDDLSEITGIKLYSGANKSDWPVRARKMNIFVKDVRMADLMNSIAHVMKFAWSRNDDVNPPTYRLVVDKKAAASADAMMKKAWDAKEQIWQKRRDEWIDAIMRYGSTPTSELRSLQEDDLMVYWQSELGCLEALRALFVEVPETRDRYASGRSFRISASDLSPETKGLLFSAGNEVWKGLQRGKVVPSPDGEPTGYGSILKPEDRFDIAFSRLDDATCFSPNLRWGSANRTNTGYFHILKGGQDYQISGLKYRDSARKPYQEREKDEKQQEELWYPSEPLADHDPFPGIDNRMRLEVEPAKSDETSVSATNTYIASLQKALFEITGTGVVSDSWINIQGDRLPDKELRLGDILDRFSANYNYNWEKRGSILEFRHRKWAKMRLNQIPDAWIAAWSENTRKNRILSLDDLSHIATLNYDQAEESLRKDTVLGRTDIYGAIVRTLDTNGNLQWLRLYSTMSPQLRDLLMTENAVNGHMLTSDQWKQAQIIFDRIGSLRGDAIFRMEHSDSFDRYTFKEFDNDTGELDREWQVRLPKYEPPPDQKDAKH